MAKRWFATWFQEKYVSVADTLNETTYDGEQDYYKLYLANKPLITNPQPASLFRKASTITVLEKTKASTSVQTTTDASKSALTFDTHLDTLIEKALRLGLGLKANEELDEKEQVINERKSAFIANLNTVIVLSLKNLKLKNTGAQLEPKDISIELTEVTFSDAGEFNFTIAINHIISVVRPVPGTIAKLKFAGKNVLKSYDMTATIIDDDYAFKGSFLAQGEPSRALVSFLSFTLRSHRLAETVIAFLLGALASAAIAAALFWFVPAITALVFSAVPALATLPIWASVLIVAVTFGVAGFLGVPFIWAAIRSGLVWSMIKFMGQQVLDILKYGFNAIREDKSKAFMSMLLFGISTASLFAIATLVFGPSMPIWGMIAISGAAAVFGGFVFPGLYKKLGEAMGGLGSLVYPQEKVIPKIEDGVGKVAKLESDSTVVNIDENSDSAEKKLLLQRISDLEGKLSQKEEESKKEVPKQQPETPVEGMVKASELETANSRIKVLEKEAFDLREQLIVVNDQNTQQADELKSRASQLSIVRKELENVKRDLELERQKNPVVQVDEPQEGDKGGPKPTSPLIKNSIFEATTSVIPKVGSKDNVVNDEEVHKSPTPVTTGDE